MKRILIISDAWHPQVNGVVRTYEHICEALKHKGHAVQVIGPADFKHAFALPMYKEIRMAFMPYRALGHMINDYAPTDIHIATEGSLGWAARRYCLDHNLSFTTTYHTHFPDYVAARVPAMFKTKTADIVKSIMCRFHNRASAMAVATQSLRDTLDSWGIQTVKCPLTRGVNTDIFYPAPSSIFQDQRRPIALYVGRVSVEKNIEDFLDMDFTGTKIVVGEGPALDMLRSAYPDVIFTGKKTGQDLADIYRAADVFVFPSRTDTFGIVLIEALACGVPVAGYTVTGPKDIITEPYLGALHDTDLALATQQALKQSDHAQKRHEHVKNNYIWGKVADQFLNLLDYKP